MPDSFHVDQADPSAAYQDTTSYQPGDIAYQGVGKGENSLTQINRSLINSQAMTGQQDRNSGIQTQKSGMDQLNELLGHYNRLIGGDRSEAMSAAGPEVDHVGNQFANIRNMFSQNGTRSGGTTAALSAAPYQETNQIDQLLNGQRRDAAQQSGSIGSALGQFGIDQQRLGVGQFSNAENSVLASRQQNNGQLAQNMQLASALL